MRRLELRGSVPARRAKAALALSALLGVGFISAGHSAAQAVSSALPPGVIAEADGDLTVVSPGVVLDGLDLVGSIKIKASNVTIRNSSISYGGYHAIRTYPEAKNTRIVDTTIRCTDSATSGIVFGDYTAVRVAVNGCRHDFYYSADRPATILDSTVDGKPFPNVPTGATSQPTQTGTSTESDTGASEAQSGTSGVSVAGVVMDAALPTPTSTGPRYQPTKRSGTLYSSSAGQVIEGYEVTGRLVVRHDNVTVRNVRVRGNQTYMVQVVKKADGTCPVNVRFDYVEIDGALAAENDIPLYSPRCGYVFNHGYIHNVGRSSRIVNDTTIANSYIFSSRTGDSGAHRGAIGHNGGNNNAVINNVLKCRGTGCSASLPMYGDFAPVTNYLVRRNLFATTAAYCAYGGSLDSKPYPDASNVRFIDNRFSTEYYPKCGKGGPVTAFEGGVRGNVASGNVWHETGLPLKF